MLFQLSLFFLLSGLRFAATEASRKPVFGETAQGKVQGQIFVVGGGVEVDAFRGIPYAEPPVDALQFKKPILVKPWEGTLKTVDWPSRCIQSWVLGEVFPKIASDSVDCLYLNVYAPHVKSEDGYPVMFWIHGGGFHFGSSVEYGLKGITERIVPKDVVFVSVHYRLGAYGFLVSNDSEALGNYGLWDQTLALRWVHENIRSFGGDPERVTVFGESAGAASTALLTLSPHSNGLFQQAILMSGTHLAPWAINPGPFKHSKMLAKELACDLPSSVETLDCLRSKRPTELSEAEKRVSEAVKYEAQMIFNPVMDGDFFPESLDVLMKKSPVKPTMAGTTHDEMGLFITPPVAEVTSSWQTTDESFSFPTFEAFLSQVFNETQFKNAALLRRLARHQYLDTQGDQRNSTFLVQQYTKVFSDFFLFFPQFMDAQQRLARGSPVWLYSFDHFAPEAFPSDHTHKGAYHLMDLTYLFDAHLLKAFNFTEEDTKLLDIMTTLWTNFAKFGNPTPSPTLGFSWKPISPLAQGQCLSLTKSPAMQPCYNCDSVAFWKELIPDIESLDLIKPQPWVHEEL